MLLSHYNDGRLGSKAIKNGDHLPANLSSYYTQSTKLWYIAEDCPLTYSPEDEILFNERGPVCLDHVMKSGDTITPNTLDNVYSLYLPKKNWLCIPASTAHLLLGKIHAATVTREQALSYLKALRYNQRYVKRATMYMVGGIEFSNCTLPYPPYVDCVVLDLSKPDKPIERIDDSNDGIVKTAYIPTSKLAIARKAQEKRVIQKYGLDTPEYVKAMEDYDLGIRRPRGRANRNSEYNTTYETANTAQVAVKNYIARLAHPTVNLFYGLLNRPPLPEESASDRRLPKLTTQMLNDPREFITNVPQADYNTARAPIGWVLKTKRFSTDLGDSFMVRTMVIEVAIKASELRIVVPNYDKACWYVGSRAVPNPVTLEDEWCAVFERGYSRTTKQDVRAGSIKALRLEVAELRDIVAVQQKVIDKMVAKIL